MQKNNLLISIDFRAGKGGIARVAQLVFNSIDFTSVLSLHGKPVKDSSVFYFNSNRFLLLCKAFRVIFFRSPSVIVFDHLNLARLLAFVPDFFLKKVVIYLHDEEAWQEITGFHKSALKKATHILCNSEYTKKIFLRHNKQFISKTEVCLPGGSPEIFQQVEKSEADKRMDWLQDPRPYCLFVSRLWKAHRYKGYMELLTAFEKHYTNSDDAFLRLAIVGNGDDEAEVERYIKEKGLGKNAALFKQVGDKELVFYYKNALCLFFPSMREGFGMVYLEAMFFCKACIGIKGQPAEEIIVDAETGRLIADNDPETLMEIIKDIESDPDKYEEYGKAGYKRYLQYFTFDKFKQRFLKAINHLD